MAMTWTRTMRPIRMPLAVAAVVAHLSRLEPPLGARCWRNLDSCIGHLEGISLGPFHSVEDLKGKLPRGEAAGSRHRLRKPRRHRDSFDHPNLDTIIRLRVINLFLAGRADERRLDRNRRRKDGRQAPGSFIKQARVIT